MGRLPASDCQRENPLQGSGYLNPLEDLDPVADTHIVVVLHADTALHAVAHFADVILKAAQGFQLAFVDDHVFTQYTARTVAVHGAFDDHTAGHRAELGRPEHRSEEHTSELQSREKLVCRLLLATK